jgi:hypothetical protein
MKLDFSQCKTPTEATTVMKGKKMKMEDMYPVVVTIRIRIGNVEAEVSGPKSWVEKQIEKIIEIVKTHSPPR